MGWVEPGRGLRRRWLWKLCPRRWRRIFSGRRRRGVFPGRWRRWRIWRWKLWLWQLWLWWRRFKLGRWRVSNKYPTPRKV